MMINQMKTFVSGVEVRTADNRGFTLDEVVDRCVDKIITVGDQTHPAIRDQAHAFKAHIRAVVSFYIKDAIRNDRHTIAIRLRDAGHPELTTILES